MPPKTVVDVSTEGTPRTPPALSLCVCCIVCVCVLCEKMIYELHNVGTHAVIKLIGFHVGWRCGGAGVRATTLVQSIAHLFSTTLFHSCMYLLFGLVCCHFLFFYSFWPLFAHF